MSLISDITFKANNNSGIESINSKNSEKLSNIKLIAQKMYQIQAHLQMKCH